MTVSKKSLVVRKTMANCLAHLKKAQATLLYLQSPEPGTTWEHVSKLARSGLKFIKSVKKHQKRLLKLFRPTQGDPGQGQASSLGVSGGEFKSEHLLIDSTRVA